MCRFDSRHPGAIVKPVTQSIPITLRTSLSLVNPPLRALLASATALVPLRCPRRPDPGRYLPLTRSRPARSCPRMTAPRFHPARHPAQPCRSGGSAIAGKTSANLRRLRWSLRSLESRVVARCFNSFRSGISVACTGGAGFGIGRRGTRVRSGGVRKLERRTQMIRRTFSQILFFHLLDEPATVAGCVAGRHHAVRVKYSKTCCATR